MRFSMKLMPGMGAALATLSALPAQAATFTSQPVVIMGSTQVAALGINDAGAIVGSVGTGAMTGFILQGSALSFPSGAYPTAVNSVGDVTGFTNQDQGFLWKNGAFVASVSFPLGTFGSTHLSPVLNRHDELAYSTTAGQSQPLAYSGSPMRHFRQIKGLSSTGALVNSINRRGVIAGTERVTIQGQQMQAVFFGKDGFFNALLSPEGQSVLGGFINDAGQVAFTDEVHGYVYSRGQTASFALPAQASTLIVQAINDQGRVVGTYLDSSQSPPVQHGFLYNGSVFASFGAYGASDLVQISLNNRGAILVSDSSGESQSSVILHCHGAGC